jgi:hypothetical protein
MAWLNAAIEIKLGATALVTHAGVLLAYWPLALPCYCFGTNTAAIDGCSPCQKRFGGNFDYNELCQFGSEVLFVPNEVCGEEQLQFQPNAAVGFFLGYSVYSGCNWGGAYIVSRVGEFATMNYHTGRRREDDKFITAQVAREVFRPGDIKEGDFRFPLNVEYDMAFDAPEGWVDSWCGPKPTLCMPAVDEKEETAETTPEEDLA